MKDILSAMKLVTMIFVTVLPILKASQTDWIPIFMAFSGNGKKVGYAWSQGNGTSPIQADRTYSNRLHHYRSPIIDSWSEHNILKGKIELHSQDCMVAWMVFDGRRTTNTDWFYRDMLLHSSFDDKREVKEFQHFRLIGRHRYPFMILRWTSKCEENSGVFVVFDEKYACSWRKYDRYPLIMYTNNGTPRNFNRDAEIADYMVVYVRM